MATNTKPLKKWSTDELETAIRSNYFHDIQKSEAESILREREREPDRKLARRTYNAAAWTRAYAEGIFIVALIILWLVATGEPPATTRVQPQNQRPDAANPEASLIAPRIDPTKSDGSSLASRSAAPQEAPAPPTEAAHFETLPAAGPPMDTTEPQALSPGAPTIAEPKEAPKPPTEAAETDGLPAAVPTVAAPAEAPLPPRDHHTTEVAPAPEETSATPRSTSAASEAQRTAPAPDVTTPARQPSTSRLRRPPNTPREATDTWKKGISVFGQ